MVSWGRGGDHGALRLCRGVIKPPPSLLSFQTDLREPSVMRVAPVPLYNSFCDVQRFYQLLREAMETVK